MNRFRKKSNSNINKKLKEDELANTNNNTGNNNSNGNGIGLTSSTSQFTLLPEVKDFRTSLILVCVPFLLPPSFLCTNELN